MKKTISGLAAAIFLTFTANSAELQTAKNPSVEYMSEPLAIDTARPRFSWEVFNAERGATQTAYQVVVSEGGADFSKQAKLIWDSGKVSSSQNVGVAYAGAPLKSKTGYFWKVSTWDKSGKKCVDSEHASFQTGIMDEKDLAGKWIWESEAIKPEDYAYFRTEFTLSDIPAEAYALVSAHNHYMLFINGQQVSGYVEPGVSDPFKSKLYRTYSIAPFLKKGKNAIAAAVFYKGASGQNYVNGVPGFLFEAWGKTRDGREIRIASGPGWKVLADTPFDESAPWLSNRKHTAAEFFDARKDPVGWKSPGFDDSAWKNAVAVKTGYKLRSEYMPESKIERVIDPVKVKKPWPGVYLFDLGEEIGGWARIIGSAPSGTQVQMRYSDRLLMGRAYQGASDEPTRTYFDRYTFSGNGTESWEPWFGYRGFRYIEVIGFPGEPTVSNIKGVFAANALKQTGHFESSNPLLNKIYQISVHTQALGMVGQIVDCVHREQSQWHADAEIQAGTIFYNFFDPHIVRKALIDLKDGQWQDGRMPDFYPASPREFNYIPEWDLRYVPMLWRTYFYYNDRYILEECWDAVKKQIAFFETLRDQTGLVKKHKAWHINDWPEDYARIDGKGEYLAVENMLYYDTLVKSAEIAKILGHSAEEQKYREIAARLKEAINKNLFDPALNAYIDCSNSSQRHAGVSALALQFGIAPDALRPQVMGYVKSKGFSTSIVLAYNLIEMLYDNDEGAFAYQIVNTESFPGWGYMVKKGATNTWESWTGLVGATYAHPFAAFMARFFISGIAGINPADPGFSKIKIRPHIDGDLKWAKADIQTVQGKISSSWEKTDNGLKLSVEIPGNSSALVSVPSNSSAGDIIYESNTLVWSKDKLLKQHPDIKIISIEKDYVDLQVGSGTYNFKTVRQ